LISHIYIFFEGGSAIIIRSPCTTLSLLWSLLCGSFFFLYHKNKFCSLPLIVSTIASYHSIFLWWTMQALNRSFFDHQEDYKCLRKWLNIFLCPHSTVPHCSIDLKILNHKPVGDISITQSQYQASKYTYNYLLSD